MTDIAHRPLDWFKAPEEPLRWLERPRHISLCTSVAMFGIKTPIEATPDGKIVDGRRRFLAAKAAGLTEIPVRIVEPTTVDLSSEEAQGTPGHEGVLPIGTLQGDGQGTALTEISASELEGIPVTVDGRQVGTVRDVHVEDAERGSISAHLVGTLQGVHVEEDGALVGYIAPGGERVVIREAPVQGPPCPRPALAQQPLRLDRLDEVKARCANHKAILEENRAQRDPESVYLPCTCELCTDLPAALETIGRLAAVVQAAVGEYDKETLGTGLKHPPELVGLMVELYKARRLLKELGG